MSEAIKCGLPTLRKVELISGRAEASGLVAIELIRLMDVMAFDLKESMIEAAADGILARFPDVNTADLVLFRLQVQRGEIGGTIYRIDARTLVQLFEAYYERRQYEMEQIIQRREDSWRNSDEQPTAEAIQKAYARMKAEAKEVKEKPPNEKIDGQILVEAERWTTCNHDFADRGDHLECFKCKSIVYK